jgi:hypothetical protein
MRRDLPVRETITYPKVTVTSSYDPCHDKSSPFEHVLGCGHLIATLKPDEPCAPNCHHATSSSPLKAQKANLSNALKKDFYCDACLEDETEEAIGKGASCQSAGQLPHCKRLFNTTDQTVERFRINRRKNNAEGRGKATKFRKCYIAQKVVSVPCDKDGYTVEGYDPYLNSHPFDTAWPPTGQNMFEDIGVTPTKARKPKKSKLLTKTTDVSDDEPPSTAEAVAEDVNGTIAEGMRWVREEEARQRRRAEEGTPSTRRRQAARPIVISSSPDTGLASFVVTSSSPVSAQASPQDDSRRPATAQSKKIRNRKRKRVTYGEAATALAKIPAKRAIATPKRRVPREQPRS